MSQNKISPEDPKLTAYALGELEREEHAALEAALRDDPAARAAVEEIRATAAKLTAALVAEPMPETKPVARSAPEQRAAIVPGGDYRKLDGGPLAQLFRFPQCYYVVGGLAAACFAMLVALRTPTIHSPGSPVAKQAGEQVIRTEIVFAPTAPSVATAEPAATASLDKIGALKDANESASDAANPALVVGFEFDKGGATPRPNDSAPAGRDLTLLGTIQPSAPVAENLLAPTANAPAPAAQPSEARRVIAGDVLDARTPAAPAAPSLAFSGKASAPSPVGAGNPAQTLKPSLLAKADSETVVLEAFTVSAERDSRVYSASSRSYSYGTRTADGSRQREAQRRLPAPPPGGRFGKNTEAYAYTPDNDFLSAEQNPLSTFSVDVDTAGYANVRRLIEGGHLPPRDAVRIEELLNYFPYHYATPKDDAPFAASLEVADAPWAPAHRLVRIGLKGREVATEARPAANLVFLLDVSGSMAEPNKLPLVKESLRLLVGKLRPDDRVAIVTYAGNSGLALPSTPVAKSGEILESLDTLTPGGSTNGAMGIELAYDIAKANFVSEGINRVILCTDGDFNVGVTSEGGLVRLIEEKAQSGVFLTVLGFGMSNYKDATLEQLADKGNGNYGYIDTRREAEKLLVEQVSGTLLTIAKDVKIQVEFNPAKVASYRLIGYENRLLKKEDFNNDKVDAGEIGAGHTVTALYEIVPVGAEKPADAAPTVDELKYQRPNASARLALGETDYLPSPELLTVKVRFKKPNGLFSRKLEFPLEDKGAQFAGASADFRFAAAVAGFGMILRESPHKGSATLGDVIAWAGTASNDDPRGYRSEFIGLVNAAKKLLP